MTCDFQQCGILTSVYSDFAGRTYHIVGNLMSRLKCDGWLVFVALRPKSTAMVIAGRSVHLTTLFPGQA